MKIYRKEFIQTLPITLEEAWSFFSSPNNLAKITPDNMTFEVTSPDSNGQMYEGMIITYKVAPIAGIKLNWVTEITAVKENRYFIDEQRFGPFAFWHHEHHFKQHGDHVIMHDILNYAIGWSLIGRLANGIMVNNKIGQIFEFRKKKVTELFGTV